MQSAAEPTNPVLPNINGNPAAIVAHDSSAKNTGAQTESKSENDHPQHLTAERIAGTEMNAVPASRLSAAGNALTGGADSMSITGATTPASQTAAAATPTIAAALPVAAANVAIPLASLPIEIATQAKDGKNRFEIRLDPPELGRIDVRLDIDSNGDVTSRLMADRPETLDLLRRDAPQIERALQDAGLKTSDQGLQFSLRDQSFADRGTMRCRPQRNLSCRRTTPSPLEAVRQGYGRLIGLGGGIDIRV